MLQEDVNWRFLVRLLDLPPPVFQSLICVINHAQSPQNRMHRLKNYVRNTFDAAETTEHSPDQLFHRLESKRFSLWIWIGPTQSRLTFYCHKGFFFDNELKYSYLTWQAWEGPLQLETFRACNHFHNHHGVDIPKKSFFDRLDRILSENST